MEKFQELRNKYPEFEYVSYEIIETDNEYEVKYVFNITNLATFTPRWLFPKPKSINLSHEAKTALEAAIFNLGMVELISYQKLTCSPKIIVKASDLTEDQINWWKKLYINGLGEFFYINGIETENDINTYAEIVCDSNKKQLEKASKIEGLEGCLIPVGGGKDSAVTLEVLNAENTKNYCYIINPRQASYQCAKLAEYEDDKIYMPRRTLDPKMLELNKQGFLNGHTPFSAIVAFSSYISAIILGRQNIVLSNESSANEANISGTNINHQYSKSIEFENDFIAYVKNYVCTDGPKYFSILRAISEWQIVKAFVKNKKYFNVFKSCNVGSKEDAWCNNCPKCLYVYIMLAAFLGAEDIGEIFKENLLEKEALRDIFNGLVFPDYDKPFECVGTKEEIDLAVNMIINSYKKVDKDLPVLLRDYSQVMTDEDLKLKIKEATNSWNEANNIEEKFESMLKEYIK